MCYFTGTYVHSVIQEYEIFENSKNSQKKQKSLTSIYK